MRTTLTTSSAGVLALTGADRDIAITPDGSRVVYRGNGRLMIRSLDRLEATVLTEGGAPRSVFSAPDGQWIGFFDGTLLLKKVAITGGPAVTITRVDGGGPRGATWGPDGTIIYGTIAPATGLQRVSASGGESTELTKPDRERGEDHYWPEFLPRGNAVLYTIGPITGNMDTAQIAVLDLSTRSSKVLVRGGSDAHYVSTGHLVYAVAGTLRAVPFDVDRLEVTGSPVPVLDGVVTMPTGGADFAIAANGSLVYLAGVAGQSSQLAVLSVDRQGRASPLPGIGVDSYRDVDVSPSGSQVALATQMDIWTYDFARAILTRLTTDPAPDTRPIWTPDGQRIIFRSDRAGYAELFWRPSNGTGADERLLSRAKDLIDLRGTGWSKDGTQFIFTEVSATIQCAIGQIAIDHPSDVTSLVKNDFCNDRGVVSPDGRWLAYESNESGQFQIYVRPFPLVETDRWQVSTDGGRQPLWSANGGELYFRGLDGRTMVAVAVQAGATFTVGRPEVLFESTIVPITGGTRSYDVTPDGRFIIISRPQTERPDGAAPSLTLVLNWFEELKRLVPR